MILLEQWQHPRRCLNCGDIIYSKRSGDFVACSCYRNEETNKGIAVDQTPWYTRVIGTCYPMLSKEELEENNIKVKESK